MTRRRWTRSSRRWREALTLIELLAALAILGWLLASMLLVRGRYVRQAALARQEIQAVRAAEALLAHWYSQDLTIPDAEEGQVPGSDNLRWTTSVVLGSAPDTQTLQIVRLCVLSDSRHPSVSARELARIDIVAPRQDQDGRRSKRE